MELEAKLRKWFGPMPGASEARAMGRMAVIAAVILCGISIFRGFRGQTFMGRPLGGDFIEFYVIGKILNSFGAARIYDLELAVNLQHSILPSMAKTQMLVYGHAPYIALLFKPFALLPYQWAYIAWLGFSAAVYLAGINLLFRSVAVQPKYRETGFWMAISFMPFLFETWIGGQMSVIVFFIWALFFFFKDGEKPAVAGMALALGLFKPTLIALPVAMLIFGRRWRILAGFGSAAAGLAFLSMRMAGLEGCKAWLGTLVFNGKMTAGQGEAWHLAKSIDAMSFFHLFFFNATPLTEIAFAACALGAFAALSGAWLRSRAEDRSNEAILWAATLCLTLVVSTYAPIYDAVLVVIAAALAWGAVSGRVSRDTAALRAWLLLLYLTPWITQSLAEFLHFQLLTPVVAGFSAWLLMLPKSWGPRRREEYGAMRMRNLDQTAIQPCSKKVLIPGIQNRS